MFKDMFMLQKRYFVIYFLLILLSANISFSAGSDIVISSSTTWAPGTYNYGTLRVESGNTLTLQADRASNSGVVINADNVIIESNAVITSSGEGHLGATTASTSGDGPGGGGYNSNYAGAGAGHGGYGRTRYHSSYGYFAGYGGDPYDNTTLPLELGSGGGRGGDSGNGGNGGGAIFLNLTQDLIVNGNLSVDAYSGNDGYNGGGGGSGGSILILANSIEGSGVISAKGGPGGRASGWFSGTGGSGGRIAMHYDDISAFSGTAQADGAWGGAAGTILYHDNIDDDYDLELNVGTSSYTKIFEEDLVFKSIHMENSNLVFDNLTVTDSINLTGDYSSLKGHYIDAASGRIYMYDDSNILHPSNNGRGIRIDAIDMFLYDNASINVSGMGYLGATTASTSGEGPGGGGYSQHSSAEGAGGGHAGYGRDAYITPGSGGSQYGSLDWPVEFGSGGGRAADSGDGGDGGGSILLNISNLLHLDGDLLSLGTNGFKGPSSGGGGGSGGSILLLTSTLEGSGTISVNGGAGGPYTTWNTGKGGAGGRIAIHYDDMSSFNGEYLTDGNGGSAPGSLVLKDRTKSDYDLYLKDEGSSLGRTVIEDNFVTENLYVRGAYLEVSNLSVEQDFEIGNNTLISHSDLNANGLFISAQNILLEEDAIINTTGLGYKGATSTGSGDGPGGGGYYSSSNGGGAGAGYGGNGSNCCGQTDIAGLEYGNLSWPQELGSGGGRGPASGNGGDGGGSVRIRAYDSFLFEGTIDSSGTKGFSGSSSGGGGGSGGSILIEANNITGSGVLQSIGGPGGPHNGWWTGGRGSGGRIALYSCYDNYVENVLVSGGTGGTYYTKNQCLVEPEYSPIEYVHPTPADKEKSSHKTNITIKFYDGLHNFDNCSVIIDSTPHPMAYENNYCILNYSFIPDSSILYEISFQGVYEESGIESSLEKRTIYIYPPKKSATSTLPSFGFGSLFVGLSIIVLALFLN